MFYNRTGFYGIHCKIWSQHGSKFVASLIRVRVQLHNLGHNLHDSGKNVQQKGAEDPVTPDRFKDDSKYGRG